MWLRCCNMVYKSRKAKSCRVRCLLTSNTFHSSACFLIYPLWYSYHAAALKYDFQLIYSISRMFNIISISISKLSFDFPSFIFCAEFPLPLIFLSFILIHTHTHTRSWKKDTLILIAVVIMWNEIMKLLENQIRE